MGPPGFFPWIQSLGYLPERPYISSQSELLVDVKGILYQLAASVPTTDLDPHQTIATLLLSKFAPFKFVLLVNDGRIKESHPKFEECCKRGRAKEKLQEQVKRQKTAEFGLFQLGELSGAEEEQERPTRSSYQRASKLERQARAARGMSYDMTIAILELVKAQQRGNISVLQCEEEADQQIMLLAPQFDWTVSRDADLLIGGGQRQIIEFGTPKQAVYNIQRICETLKITLLQLQEIASLKGNDYTQGGIYGMGWKHAYTLITKYGSCQTMLRKWKPEEHATFDVPKDILHRVNVSVSMYSSGNWEGDMNKKRSRILKEKDDHTSSGSSDSQTHSNVAQVERECDLLQ